MLYYFSNIIFRLLNILCLVFSNRPFYVPCFL